MSIHRVVPDIATERLAESRSFYTEFLGFDIAMDTDAIVTFISPENPTAQISLTKPGANGPVEPAISIEVADVAAVHAAAMKRGETIVYPLTDEPWGVRRFFVRDPNGVVINVLSHIPVGQLGG